MTLQPPKASPERNANHDAAYVQPIDEQRKFAAFDKFGPSNANSTRTRKGRLESGRAVKSKWLRNEMITTQKAGVFFCAAAVGGCAHAPQGRSVSPPVPSAASVVTVADVGFSSPENIVYDAVADVYLVSNINGDARARDGNGFISRVSPDGRVLALRWIDGFSSGVRLDGPKGLALSGDTLFVADIGAVRLFNRRTGASIASRAVPGELLNDIALGADGSVYVTDTGPDRSPQPIDTIADMDAIYRFDHAAHPVTLARGLRLERPDGIVVASGDVIYATFGANRIVRLRPNGTLQTVSALPGAQVDGLRALSDGSLIVTSWGARAVYRIMPSGEMRVELSDVTTPAGVVYDAKRSRLIVTSMQSNRLFFVPLR